MAGRKKVPRGEFLMPKSRKESTKVWRAWCSFGDFDGKTIRIDKRGRTKAIAEKAVVEDTGARKAAGRKMAADSPLSKIAEAWLTSVEPPENPRP